MEEKPQAVKPPLGELRKLIMSLSDTAYEEVNDELQRVVERLAQVYSDIQGHYAQVTPVPGQVWDAQVPTPAQGVALARFLKPHWQEPGQASAWIQRGGNGLGGNYVYVRLNSGYEGGISLDGKVST